MKWFYWSAHLRSNRAVCGPGTKMSLIPGKVVCPIVELRIKNSGCKKIIYLSLVTNQWHPVDRSDKLRWTCALTPNRRTRFMSTSAHQPGESHTNTVLNIETWRFELKLSVMFIRLSTGAVYSVILISGARWTLHWDGWCFEPPGENRRWFVEAQICFYIPFVDRYSKMNYFL